MEKKCCQSTSRNFHATNAVNTIYDRDLQTTIRIARQYWNTSLWCTSSIAQSITTHAKDNSTGTASTKKRKSHLQPSVLYCARKLNRIRRQSDDARNRRASIFCSSQRNLRLPEKAQCFVQILTFKSHPWCSSSNSNTIHQQWLAKLQSESQDSTA